MTIRNAIFNSLMALALLAVPVQFLIEPSVENVASSCLVLASALTVLLYLRGTSALESHPLSSFAILGFCLTSQLGALLVQTIALTPLTHALYDPLYTYGTLAFYQFIAVAVHIAYRFFSVGKSTDAGFARRLLQWAGVYKTPSCATLWYMGCISLPALILFGREGVLARITTGFHFLVWAPFLIPIYSRELGESYCNGRLNKLLLAAYLAAIGLIGLATNARGIMLIGVATIALIYLLAGMRSREPVRGRAVIQLGALAAVLLAISGPISDLATSMAIARYVRGKVPAVIMMRTTFHIWGQPGLIAAYRADQEARSRYSSYDEYYIANPMLARLIETKFYDNSFHFAKTLTADKANASLRDVSIKFALAGLPTPVLNALGIPINKDDLNYSMGDYLAYLSRGVPLGGRKTGNMFAQGIALFGPLFPFLFAVMCLALFNLMDLLSIKSAGKAVSTSALGMLQIFGFFMGGLSFESLHKVLHFFIRVFPQTIFIYTLVFAIARLPQRKSQVPFEARNVPAWQRSL